LICCTFYSCTDITSQNVQPAKPEIVASCKKEIAKVYEKGFLANTSYYRYDETNSLLLEIATYDTLTSLESKALYSYTDFDSISELIRLKPDSTLIVKWVYRYNNERLLSSLSNIDSTTDTVYYVSYSYNDFGIKTMEQLFRPHNQLVSYKEFHYSQSSHLDSILEYSADSLRFSTTTIKYDKNNLRSEDIKFTNFGDTIIATYTYDNKGNVIEIHIQSTYVKTAPWFQYEFDEFSNRTHVRRINGDNVEYESITTYNCH
jgi:hypothetical protein